MNDEELDEIINNLLDKTDKILMKPDIPHAQIYQVMNQLSAYAARLRIKALSETDKDRSSKMTGVANSISKLVDTLKYQAKQHQQNSFERK